MAFAATQEAAYYLLDLQPAKATEPVLSSLKPRARKP
jgi:hypothetical protein